jgi:multidrug resistance protein
VTAPARPDARAQLGRLTVLIATCFVDMIGFAIVLPILPFYALDLEGTPFAVGVITAAFSGAQLLSAPLWGRVSDRYGRRPALMIGLFASAVAYLVFAAADTLWLIFLSRLVQGAGGGTTGVANAYVADSVEPANRARALGWLSAATSAGVMVGPVIGSFAYQWGGRAMPGIVAALLCLVNLAFAWRWLPESRVPGAQAEGSPRTPIRHAAWRVVRHPASATSRLILIYAVGMLAFAALTSILALFLGARFGVTARTVGYFFFYVGGLSVVIRTLLLGPIVDRIGETWSMRLGTLLMILGFLLYPVVPSIPWLLAIIPLIPLGTALLFPTTTSLLSASTNREDTGMMMGVAQTFGGIARVAAPLAATAAFELRLWLPFVLAAATVGVVTLMAFRVPVVARPGRAAATG